MSNRIALDPSQPIEIYFRVNRNGIVKKFIFTNEDGSAHNISSYNFELFCKQTEQSPDKVFSLTVANGGLVVSGAGANELDVILTTSHSNVRARQYYGELFAQSDEVTWFNIDLFAHKGKFDGVTETTGVTIQLEGNNVNITVASGGLTLGETSTNAYRGDRGKTAYDHSQLTSGNPHNVTAAQAGADPAGSAAAAQAAAISTAATDATTKANAAEASAKSYADGLVVGLLDFKGSTNCSANPNYPNALKGDAYVVSVAGKIGGASGKSVDVGDVYVASADNAGGTEASVGTSWFVLEHNLAGALLAANNLSDVSNAATARTNIGAQALVISETALVDGATIDIAAQNNTLATSRSTITFTISSTATFNRVIITLTGTSLVLTFPANSLCVNSDGTASGDNTCTLSGTSGDVYEIMTAKRVSTYSVIAKNIGQ